VELIDDHRDGALDWARTFFGKLNYSGFFVFRRKTYRFSELTPEMLNIKELDQPGARKDMDFVCNFIFVPTEERRARLCAEIDAYFAA